MPSFYIPQLKALLPTLEECYGFDIYEISYELSHIYLMHYNEKRTNDDLEKMYTDKNGALDTIFYGINTEEHLGIRTTADFNEQFDSIVNLCSNYIKDKDLLDETTFILLFMSAIFNRDINDLNFDAPGEDLNQELMRSSYVVRPDLLRLFIALNKTKTKHKYNTPIKICFKTDSPHLIKNEDGWFSGMLNEYIKQKLGDMSIQKAEEELATSYSDKKGRKSKNSYLNYIIYGTYNLIKRVFPSDKVTVQQCNFLLQYLKVIGQIKDEDTLNKVNNLQSHIRELSKSQCTPVQRHIKDKRFTPLKLQSTVIY